MCEDVQPKPKSIVRAINTVKKAIKAEVIEKTGQTTEGETFKFTKVDAIYLLLGEKMADAGLVIDVLEAEPTKFTRIEVETKDEAGNVVKKSELWGEFRFLFQHSTEDDSWTDLRASRTLMVLIDGPQKFQAVQSFADKSYLRALFKLPSGESELDQVAPDRPVRNDKAAPAGKTKGWRDGRKTAYAAKRDEKSTPLLNEIRDKIEKAKNAASCQQTWQLYGEEIREMPRRWFDMLAEDFMERMKELGVEVELDAEGWPIIETREAA